MKGSLVALPVIDSPAARLDARWRLAGLALLLAATAIARTVTVAGLELVAAAILVWWAGVPGRWCRERLAPVLLVLLPVALLLPLSWVASADSWQLGVIYFSPERGRLVILIFAKAVALVLLLQVVLVTAPITTTLKAAHHLHVPGLIVQLLMLSNRYVYVLGDELSRLRIALRVRGFRNRPTKHAYRTVGHLAGTLLLRGYERAERVGQAMACRGYSGRFHALTQFHTTTRDILFFVVLAILSVSLLALDWGMAHG
ncbi:MAG TPA: cobalt ECF transporter T component CbiQ [Gemmataceae bacterium]|jgi:cobalt/nickel transport system permease protein|nr:cobalt ECF transporter T component CbiQ [Gemmataceae bacterium]